MSDKEDQPNIFLTGFGSFHGISENPTQIFVESFQKNEKILVNDFLFTQKDQKNYKIVSSQVIEVSMNAVDEYFQNLSKLLDSSKKIFLIHFGVHGSSKEFVIESKAKNEATFRSPDERLNSPMNQKIENNFSLNHWNSTTVVVEPIVSELKKKYPVKLGEDPGRFVCNYIYYKSLKFSEENNTQSVFIHVPDQKTIPVEDQIVFFNELLENVTK
jgi:pyroglutamyl-peptidase